MARSIPARVANRFRITPVIATIATLMAAGGLFARKSRYAITVETTFVVAMVVIMILVHAVLQRSGATHVLIAPAARGAAESGHPEHPGSTLADIPTIHRSG